MNRNTAVLIAFIISILGPLQPAEALEPVYPQFPATIPTYTPPQVKYLEMKNYFMENDPRVGYPSEDLPVEDMVCRTRRYSSRTQMGLTIKAQPRKNPLDSVSFLTPFRTAIPRQLYNGFHSQEFYPVNSPNPQLSKSLRYEDGELIEEIEGTLLNKDQQAQRYYSLLRVNASVDLNEIRYIQIYEAMGPEDASDEEMQATINIECGDRPYQDMVNGF